MIYKYPLVSEGLSETELSMAASVIQTGRNTMGTHVEEFEYQFAEKIGAQNAVMVNSGSSANLLALESLIRPSRTEIRFTFGSYIAVPAVLWPTTFWPIIQLGFKPLLIDVLPSSLEIDFSQLSRARLELGEKLIGAILIHPLGKALEKREISNLVSDKEFFVIEDTCESLFAQSGNSFAGTIGNLGTFSFFYSHHMTTMEGGMVVTNSSAHADDLRSMRAHGWTRNRHDKDFWHHSNKGESEQFLFVSSGFNFRPLDFQGLLGKSQLSSLEEFISKRILNATRLNESLRNNIALKLIGGCEECSECIRVDKDNSWMAFPLLARDMNTKVEIVKQLDQLGVETRPLLSGNFVNQPVARNMNISCFDELRNASDLYERGFMVGNHHSTSEEQLDFLIRSIEFSTKSL